MANYTVIACVSITVLLVASVLTFMSIDTVEPLYYGIPYNKITKSISGGTYDNGLYFLSPVTKFIHYPAFHDTIEFSDKPTATAPPLMTRTKEGLSLKLSVSFQYLINKDDLEKLYGLTNVNYFATYVRIARDIILKVAGNYVATSYWEKRKDIGLEMQKALNQALGKAYATCSTAQVMNIGLPKSYEDSIVQTQVEVQYTNMKKFEQEAALIRKDIDILESEATRSIEITKSEGKAQSTLIVKEAEASNKTNTINAQSEVFKKMQDEIELEKGQIGDFLAISEVKNKPEAKLMVGLNQSIINFGNQPSSQ